MLGTIAIALAALLGAAGAIEWGDVDWMTNYDTAAVKARKAGKPIFLLFQEAPG